MVAGAPVVRPLVVVSGVENDRNAFLCADLSVDPDAYLGLDPEALTTLAKRPHSPIVRVRTNAHPLLWPIDSGAPGLDRLLPLVRDRAPADPVGSAAGHRLAPNEIKQRAGRVVDAMDFAVTARTVVDAIAAARPKSVFVEQQIYEALADGLDYRIACEFLAVDREERLKAFAQLRDPRLREFAARILYDEAPEQLDRGERARLDAWLHARIHGPKDAPWRTLAQARGELTELTASQTQEGERMADIAAYLDFIARSAPF